jgi:hypothetical protein
MVVVLAAGLAGLLVFQNAFFVAFHHPKAGFRIMKIRCAERQVSYFILRDFIAHREIKRISV